jgi:hypothetical protein
MLPKISVRRRIEVTPELFISCDPWGKRELDREDQAEINIPYAMVMGKRMDPVRVS